MMIGESMFNEQHLAVMKRALTAYSVRHRVVADNLANINTEDYRAKSVSFEDALAQQSSGPVLRGSQTSRGHFPIGESSRPSAPEIEEIDSGFDNGVNDVNVDREMAELAKNDLAFRLATRLLSKKYQGIHNAIVGEIR